MVISKIIGISGADGAGKTTYANQLITMEYLDSPVLVHPVPITSKFARPDRYGITVELLMGLEKLYTYLRRYPKHLKNGHSLILDRCFVDAEVYALYRSIKTGSKWPIWLAMQINRFALKPNQIVLLSVNHRLAKPKRSYSQDDIKMLGVLFWEVLMLNGYRSSMFSEEYSLGSMFYFSKSNQGLDTESRIRAYYVLMKKELA